MIGAGIDLSVVPQFMFAGMDSFVLLCIPGFVLAGNLMNRGGITDQIVRFGNAVVGHVRGGLGLANILGLDDLCRHFRHRGGRGGVDRRRDDPGHAQVRLRKPFSAALTASASTVGPIIPPSVPMIIVGTLTGLSVGKMFLAGAIPGI